MNHTPETIFEEALQFTDLQERASYLAEVCGEDRALRLEAESLLTAHFAADQFMDTVADPVWREASTEKEGDRIGRYVLLERIAEGGFGVVFRAEQTEPVKRIVALKVIKPGMDSKEVVTRFELERQALAMMDHPNIAKVYDAGTTGRGLPYFVMELVDGKPLTTFCDEQCLDIRGRLKLFSQICVAVQHAHQKGIIHRDLKPSNILVAKSDDGSPFPKVIDFGVAKAISLQLTKETFLTMCGRMMGTPRYMSPEQAELNVVDVDTRSDIYSLGVILYELATGSAPLREKEMSSANFDEVRRMIREQEPVKPSDRVTQLTEVERRDAARARHIEDGKFWRHLHGDLDWIAMKALAKDRERRYDTAQGLAVDVRRYLRGLPVGAGPPGTSYRVGKFVRRNRWPVAVGVLTLITLLAVIVAIVLLYLVMRKDLNQVVEDVTVTKVDSLMGGVSMVRNLRAEVSGSRGQALRILRDIGLYPREEIVRLKGEEAAEKLRNDARSELIACLLWTDLHENRLAEFESPKPPAALDANHGVCALRGGDRRLEVIRATTGEMLAARDGLKSDIRGPVRFDADGDLLAAGLGTPERWELVIWNWDEDRFVTEGLPGVNEAFDFFPDGSGFAMGTGDGTLRQFDANGAERGAPLTLPGEPLVIRFSPKGRRLAVSVRGAGIAIVDLSTRETSPLSSGPDATSLDWSPDGGSIVAGAGDGSVTVRQAIGSGKTVFRKREHAGSVDQVVWSHDGLLIASGSRDGVIQLRDSRQGELLCKFPAWARTLSFSPEDRTLGPVTPETAERALSILEVERSPVCNRTAGHSADSIAATAWSPDGTILATAADDGVRLWNRRGAQLEYFEEDRVQPGGLACSRTHLYLAEAQGISRRTIDVSSGHLDCGPKEPLGTLAGGAQIALSPDGSYLAVAHNTEVVLLDPESGEIQKRLPAPDTTTSLAINHDGTVLAAGTGKGSTVRVWRLTKSGESFQDLPVDGAATVAFFPLPQNPITKEALPPVLMTGDGILYKKWVWIDAKTEWVVMGQKPSEMADGQGSMAHIAYSPRGTALVVSYNRKYLQVLDPGTLDLMSQPGFKEQWPLSISPHGYMLATEAADGRLFLWNLAELRKELKLSGLDWKELPDFPRDTIPLITL